MTALLKGGAMIDRLYLELSQCTHDTTKREAELQAEIAALRGAVREGWGIISTESAFEFPSGRARRWYELPCVVRALEEER